MLLKLPSMQLLTQANSQCTIYEVEKCLVKPFFLKEATVCVVLGVEPKLALRAVFSPVKL